jgi:hypothetical protein
MSYLQNIYTGSVGNSFPITFYRELGRIPDSVWKDAKVPMIAEGQDVHPSLGKGVPGILAVLLARLP